MVRRGFLEGLLAAPGLAKRGGAAQASASGWRGFVGDVDCVRTIWTEQPLRFEPAKVARRNRSGQGNGMAWELVEPLDVRPGDIFQVEDRCGVFQATGLPVPHPTRVAIIPAREVLPADTAAP
jgi:hypothetical protein